MTNNSTIHLRPKFKIGIDKSKDVLVAHLKDALTDDSCKYTFKKTEDHFFIDIPKSESKIWSPQLQVEFTTTSENQTQVKGLFGPKPEIWTFFIFIHFIVAMVFLGFAVLLYANTIIGKPITLPLIMIMLMPVIWVILYCLGRYGKHQAKAQTIELRGFIEKILY